MLCMCVNQNYFIFVIIFTHFHYFSKLQRGCSIYIILYYIYIYHFFPHRIKQKADYRIIIYNNYQRNLIN